MKEYPDYWVAQFADEELEFAQGTDDLGDIPEAEASYYSLYGYLPGAMHWPYDTGEARR